jgi:hypothetical protein
VDEADYNLRRLIVLEDLARRAAMLTTDEKLQLAALLIEQAREGKPSTAHASGWRDLRARLAEPALGEDAQHWVSRTRQEGDRREAR